MKDYAVRKGVYLAWLIGGSIGSVVLWVAGLKWLGAAFLFNAVVAAVALGIEEKWQQE